MIPRALGKYLVYQPFCFKRQHFLYGPAALEVFDISSTRLGELYPFEAESVAMASPSLNAAWAPRPTKNEDAPASAILPRPRSLRSDDRERDDDR